MIFTLRRGARVPSADLRVRLGDRKDWQKGNRMRGWRVEHCVGKSRVIGAALIAAGFVLSGCSSGAEGDPTTTTTSAAAETPINPWDLPLEDRPALFDPCTELPLAAVEEALGAPVEPIDLYTHHRPGGLMVCGWESENWEVNVLSTWKSRDEYLADDASVVEEFEMAGRPGMRLFDRADKHKRSCTQLFFTERGTTWLGVTPIGLFREFNGERFVDSCDVLEQVIVPIVEHFPEGDFE